MVDVNGREQAVQEGRGNFSLSIREQLENDNELLTGVVSYGIPLRRLGRKK